MILFRKINETMPGYWLPIHWYVEHHDDDAEMAFPTGMAFVTECSPHLPWPAVLDFVFVVDHFRRQGIASKLVKACQERWPGILMTDPISEAGEGLTTAIEEEQKEALASRHGPGQDTSPDA